MTSATKDFKSENNMSISSSNTEKRNDAEEKDEIFFISKEESDAVGLEENNESTKEAAKEEAYNPETGEINWDCPCIAGMTKPPCGEMFKEAFSCFVYSETEPKGSDCVEQFRAMQDCFQRYPEIYGGESDEEEQDALTPEESQN